MGAVNILETAAEKLVSNGPADVQWDEEDTWALRVVVVSGGDYLMLR